MSILQIPTARSFLPLLKPARYKGAYGGRGSGKSHFFGEHLVEECIASPGTLAVCIREVQKTLAQSSKRLIESKIESLGVGSHFRVFNDKIETPGDGVVIFQGMQDHTAESIKSLEGFRIAWIEEAQTLSQTSLDLLRPTIRVDGSEIWASWNPTRKNDAVDKFLRGRKAEENQGQAIVPPANAVVIKVNWRDNPWWNQTLEDERQLDEASNPEGYDHIWEGGYAQAFKGSYFAKELAAAKRENRIGRVSADPLLPLRAFWDLGGSGHAADALAIWVTQWVGQEIRVLDFLEGQSQPLAYYVNWLREKRYDKAVMILPHDGVKEDAVAKGYDDHLRDAGFDVPQPIPNQGPGAAKARIEAARRIFPKVWFNENTTEAGRTALGFYHERKHDLRDVGLGPEHDWSSHAADAFGLMAICYEEPSRSAGFNRKLEYQNAGRA